MTEVAIVSPETGGGVRYLTEKIIKGLRMEDSVVAVSLLDSRNLIYATLSDLRKISELQKVDRLIYMGSIPWPSYLFARSGAKVMLFVHGFVMNELINAIKRSKNSRAKIGNIYLMLLWKTGRIMDKVDFYICHSLTTCEMNEIYDNCVLLPQFVFSDEMKFFTKFKRSDREWQDSKKLKIVTYSSLALSPRLLKTPFIVKLMKEVSKNIENKEVELTILDPHSVGRSEERIGNLVVRYLGFLPRNDFLQLLANSDLYIECCIDEELRLGSIEAALLGTPIAKLTRPKYVERQDYDEELIWASTFRGLVKAISDYLNDVDCWKPVYSERLREFIVNRRSWDKVKEPLVRILRE
jgi:hypothetical protein